MSVHFMSERHDWATPWALFRELAREFSFTVDVAASPDNAKCARFYTREDDGLAQPWAGETCWMNPPYGRAIARWVERAAEAAREEGSTVVALIPSRTDTDWWHRHIWDERRHAPRHGVTVRFLRGRVRFGDTTGNPAPFPSAIVVFRPAPSASDASGESVLRGRGA